MASKLDILMSSLLNLIKSPEFMENILKYAPLASLFLLLWISFQISRRPKSFNKGRILAHKIVTKKTRRK